MNSINPMLPFSQEEIDVQNYTASLIALCEKFGIINSEKIYEINNTLASVFTETAEQYTKRESSSVTKKRAELIFSSIMYWADVYLLSQNSVSEAVNTLKQYPMEFILKRGQDLILTIHSLNIKIYKKAYISRLNIDCYEYNYAMEKSFAEYEKTYSARFNARECDANIDYPLLNCPAHSMKSQGVMFINEYYGKILLENEFCEYFDFDKLKSLLVSYGRIYNCSYRDILFNIAEVAANNLLANALLKRTDFELELSIEDVKQLENMCAALSANTLLEELMLFFSVYKNRFNNISVYNYISNYIPEFIKAMCERAHFKSGIQNFLTVNL